jgi:hypothetical protein
MGENSPIWGLPGSPATGCFYGYASVFGAIKLSKDRNESGAFLNSLVVRGAPAGADAIPTRSERADRRLESTDPSDTLVDLIYALKAGHRQNGTFMLNRKVQAEGWRQVQEVGGRVTALMCNAELALEGCVLVSLFRTRTRSRREPKTRTFRVEVRFRAVTE